MLPTVNVPKLVISTTWPWNEKVLCPITKVPEFAKNLGATTLAAKVSDGTGEVGIGPTTKTAWDGKTTHDLEPLVKSAPYKLGFSMWCGLWLSVPITEARLIKGLVSLYNPKELWLDAEGTAKKNIANLGAFLRELGRLPCKVYLQSYRAAHLHNEMQWVKWYSYKDQATGQFIVDGLGHQLYPIGFTTTKQWIDDHKRSIESHQKILDEVGRPDLPWFPTLPVYIGTGYEGAPGWKPTPEVFLESTQYLVTTLGARLMGINLWSMDRKLIALPDIFDAIAKNIKVSGATPAPRVHYSQLTDRQVRTALFKSNRGETIFDANGYLIVDLG